MKKFLALLFAALVPLVALAQQGPGVPVIIINDGKSVTTTTAPEIARPVPGGEFPNFPETAITRIGQNTTGQHVDAPGVPTVPSPAPAASGPTPATPASPTPPASPASKLWPRDTVELFMPSCIGFYPQFAIPCGCVITRLMAEMPHDEFLRKSDAGTIEQDPRLSKIRTDCASAPQKKE